MNKLAESETCAWINSIHAVKVYNGILVYLIASFKH